MPTMPTEEGSIQEQGTLPTQLEQEFTCVRGTQQQVQNNMGGWVNGMDDLKRLLRFIIMGSENGSYHADREMLERETIRCLVRLIAEGKGIDAVRLIKEISVERRNVKQKALLLALALCARSIDKDTKEAAYEVLSEVCRIPTHLFMFINFCEAESYRTGSIPGRGWGRAHKRAVAKWYTNFADHPNGVEELARLITKYKNRESWTHKDVVRLAHPSCCDPPELAFILMYIAKDLAEAKNRYQQVEFRENENLQKIIQLLEIFEEASRCHNADQLCGLIREHKLSWEHCTSDMLRKKDVWLALLPHMPITALVRNLGRMTAIGLFSANSEDLEIALKKLQRLPDTDQREAEEGLEGDIDMDRRSQRRRIHPCTILLGYEVYKNGRGERGKSRWEPNNRILDALKKAFYGAFQNVERTNKKYFLAVDVSKSMAHACLGSRSIKCSVAAAAMTMMTVRTEGQENVIVKGFRTDMEDLDVGMGDDLEAVISKMETMSIDNTDINRIDCSLPMKHAIENKMRDIDVFVIYTDNETWYGNVHPSEAMRQYRTYASKPDAKLIVFGMNITEFTIADPDDPNMLDVVGFDSGALRVMTEFVAGRLTGV